MFSVATAPTYYENVSPILAAHCQSCHRAGQIAPFPLETFQQARTYAAAIAKVTQARYMPPWFADSCCGHFSNDPSLKPDEIETLAAWAAANAPEGDIKEAPPPRKWAQGWTIDTPDIVLSMPEAKHLPAHGDVPYQYIILPTNFKTDRWVRMSEIRPGIVLLSTMPLPTYGRRSPSGCAVLLSAKPSPPKIPCGPTAIYCSSTRPAVRLITGRKILPSCFRPGRISSCKCIMQCTADLLKPKTKPALAWSSQNSAGQTRVDASIDQRSF